MFMAAINAAKERLWIASPYFVPDESIMNSLHLAALRGVDVRILIPDKADTLVGLPGRLLLTLKRSPRAESGSSRYTRWIPAPEGGAHRRRDLAAVGTANFDNRSFRLNFEIMAVVADPTFAAEIEQMFLDDFEKSVEMQPGDYEKKIVSGSSSVCGSRGSLPRCSRVGLGPPNGPSIWKTLLLFSKTDHLSRDGSTPAYTCNTTIPSFRHRIDSLDHQIASTDSNNAAMRYVAP